MRAIVVSALLAGGCKLGVEPSGTFRCDDNHACPDGYDCIGEFCVRPEIDAAPGGQPDGGGEPTAGCGKMSLLSDDFGAGDGTSFQWAVGDPAQLEETGGQLVISPEPESASSFPHYISVGSYDLLDSSVTVEVPQTTSQTEGVYTSLTAQVFTDDLLHIEQSDGGLTVRREQGGGVQEMSGPSYVPEDHRFWRLRDDGDELLAEASPEGDTWITLATFDRDPLFRYAHVMLEAGTFLAVAAPGAAHFEGVNQGGAEGVFCKLHTFTDDFDDGAQGAAWEPDTYNNFGTMFEEDDGLRIELGAADNAQGVYIASPRFDRVDSSLTVEVAEVSAAGTITWIGLRAHQQERLEVQVVAEASTLKLRLIDVEGVSDEPAVAYDPEAHLWWRLAEKDGDLVFSASSDGMEWVEIDRIDDPFTSPVYPYLGAANYDGIDEPGRARFRNLNLPPSASRTVRD